MPDLPAFAIGALALLAAFGMGLALQRGGTCVVAAIEELVNRRRAERLLALLEAAVWVGIGLSVARALGAQPGLPGPPPLGPWTFVGAALLALGALVNGACVFGAVARLGSGQWAYVATPLGFFAGCLTVSAARVGPVVLDVAAAPAPAFEAATGPGVAAWLAAAATLRLLVGLRAHVRRSGWRSAPSPHAATAAIGLAFLALLLLAGAWSYTDALSDLARRMTDGTGPLWLRGLLAGGLLAGALAGGRATGQWRHQRPTAGAVARCLAGGWLLGCGSVLVPGGNDSLILLGLPLLWPHAWAGVGVMCAVIAVVTFARGRPASAEALPRPALERDLDVS